MVPYSLNRVFLNLNIYELKTQDICTCAHTLTHIPHTMERHTMTAVEPFKKEKTGNTEESLVLNNFEIEPGRSWQFLR